MQRIENCEVEWDQRRGVLYVNNKDDGTTVVRISGLPVARDSAVLGSGQMIDIRADEHKCAVPVI